jgi:hypothetical protein
MGNVIQTLKDSSYRVLGYIEQESNGTLTIKDASYRVKGYYDPKQNETKDSSYRVVGHGNLLTTLL